MAELVGSSTDLQKIEVTGKTRMSFDVSEFKSKIGNIVRPNIFSVKISSVSKILQAMDYSTGYLEDMEFRCERAELPGKSIATVDDVSNGPSMKLPYDVTYNDIQLTFICSEDMFERRFFESWIDEIVALPSTSHNVGGTVRYYDEFALNSNLVISQGNSKGERILTYELYDAYPIQLSPMTLAWEETNTYQRFTVTFTYRYHVMRNPESNY